MDGRVSHRFPIVPNLAYWLAQSNTHVQSFVSYINTAESALKSFLAGGVGGVCVVLVGHPLDLIKVRMQTAGAGGSTHVLGMLSQTLAKEGVRGIYRGASAPLVSISFIFAVCFCKLMQFSAPLLDFRRRNPKGTPSHLCFPSRRAFYFHSYHVNDPSSPLPYQ